MTVYMGGKKPFMTVTVLSNYSKPPPLVLVSPD